MRFWIMQTEARRQRLPWVTASKADFLGMNALSLPAASANEFSIALRPLATRPECLSNSNLLQFRPHPSAQIEWNWIKMTFPVPDIDTLDASLPKLSASIMCAWITETEYTIHFFCKSLQFLKLMYSCPNLRIVLKILCYCK